MTWISGGTSDIVIKFNESNIRFQLHEYVPRGSVLLLRGNPGCQDRNGHDSADDCGEAFAFEDGLTQAVLLQAIRLVNGARNGAASV